MAEQEDDEQLPEVSTIHDAFCVVLCFLDKGCRKNESNEDILANVLLWRQTLRPWLVPEIPQTWHGLLKFVEQHSPVPLVQVKIYDVCANDCVLFRHDLKTALRCPHCGFKRTKHRRFPYTKVADRIRRWLSSPNWSRLLEFPVERELRQVVKITDVLDGGIYRRLVDQHGFGRKYDFFAGLGCDGIIARVRF